MMSKPASRPNILLITTDQQRYDSVGEASPSFMMTPHFDWLTRQGITYRRAYADSPSCVPSRTSIMTGQTVFTHGMSYNGRTDEVMGNQGTLPDQLRSLGYQTVGIGKMHFSPIYNRHGFDQLVLPADYYRQTGSQSLRHGVGQNEFTPALSTVPEAETLTSWIAEQSAEFLKHHRDPTCPFFLWVSFTKPHPPLDPPEPYYSMYRDEDLPEPDLGDWIGPESAPPVYVRRNQAQSYDQLDASTIRRARAAYYGLVTQIDYNIGRIFATLTDLGILDDTLIMFMSDHGEFLGDHGTAGKVFFHEPSARVPLVLRLPTSAPERPVGEVVDVPVTHADVLPTLVTAAGGEPAGHDGDDLIAIAADPGSFAERPVVAMTTSVNRDPTCPDYLGITDGRWKYIWYPEGAVEQFFDLEEDPSECRNLAGVEEAAAEVDRMRRQLIERLHATAPHLLAADGSLTSRAVVPESTADRRTRANPGLFTAAHDEDTLH